MSRRNRDYSLRYNGGRYHSAFNDDDPLWLRLSSTAIAALVVGALSLGAERIGDAWAHRGDENSYDEAGEDEAAKYGQAILQASLATVVDARGPNAGGARDVKSIPSSKTDMRQRFNGLANAALPDGQRGDQADELPFRFDLEWNGYGGKNNSGAPEKHCIILELPDDTVAVAAWQVNTGRATLEIVGTPEDDLSARLCQYGRNNVGRHHEVAVMAIPSGGR